MKVAVTAAAPSLDAQVDPRFGRCPYFLVVDTDTLDFEAIENMNVARGGGAGIQSAQLIADRGVLAVLTGNCGPNAHRTLSAAGIAVVPGCAGRVRDTLKQCDFDHLEAAAEPTVQSHFGMGGAPVPGAGMGRGGGGGGRGMGMRGGGGGGGMGMGGGGGSGMGPNPAGAAPSPAAGAQELEALRQRAEMMQTEMEGLREQLRALSGGATKTARVDQTACVGCGACVAACPMGAIRLGNLKAHIDPDRCTGCGECVAVCPNQAISLI